jgi:hypothetical protein
MHDDLERERWHIAACSHSQTTLQVSINIAEEVSARHVRSLLAQQDVQIVAYLYRIRLGEQDRPHSWRTQSSVDNTVPEGDLSAFVVCPHRIDFTI